MRKLGLVIGIAVSIACSSSNSPNDGNGDPDTSGDTDDNGDNGNAGDNDNGDTDNAPAPPTFDITTSSINADAGANTDYCYYFTTPNSDSIFIKTISSHATAGIANATVFLYDGHEASSPADGTVQADCAVPASPMPLWSYAAYAADGTMTFPSNDGSGTPVGRPLPASTSGIIMMHVENSSSSAIAVQQTLSFEGYAAGTTVTATLPFVAYHNNINVGPGSGTTGTAQAACVVPDTVKFLRLSTHTHQHAIKAIIGDSGNSVDAGNQLLESDDFTAPTVRTFDAPFYTFANGNLYYECDYINDGSNTLHAGASETTDEQCWALGYFFPATHGVLCITGTELIGF